MSRCFPFPPPGYEKKGIPDDVNLIVEEKHKQKRHKDKKDKDKKDRSGRKEKERSEGKHKKIKDHKQKKHRDKKDKKEDKQRSSEEKKIVESLENQNGEKLGPGSKPSSGIQDYRILVELGKGVRNDSGATDSQMVQKINLMEQKNTNLLGNVEEQSGGMLAEAYDYIRDKRDHGWMANTQSLKVGARGLENGMVGNFSGENQSKGGNEKNRRKNCDGIGDGHKNKDRDKKSKAEYSKRKKEKIEQIKQRESGGDVLDFCNNKPSDILKESRDCLGNLPKSKEPEFNGFLHDKGIRPNNMSRPASSSHQVSQNGSGFIPSQNITNLAVEKGGVSTNHKVNGKFSSSQSVIKNVRNMEPGRTANNFIAENGRAVISNHVVNNGPISSHFVGIERKIEPRKTTSNVAKVNEGIVNNIRVDDRVQSSRPVVENGRKMAGPNVDKTAEWQGPETSHKMDNNESKMNGVLEGKPYTSPRALSACVKAKEKVDIYKKPPHPDSKYLSQILSVPKVEWPQFDDQEWLFGCTDSQAKRPKLASSQIEWTKQVWTEAIRVESADVTALPYVVPY